MVERIEVVKGPRSTLWGSDAIGGVVNVVTRRGRRQAGSMEAGYGNYDTRSASLNGGVALGSSADLDVGCRGPTATASRRAATTTSTAATRT